MLALAFAQLNFRAKDKRPNVVFVNVFLVLAFTFGAIGFNTYDIDLEYKENYIRRDLAKYLWYNEDTYLGGII